MITLTDTFSDASNLATLDGMEVAGGALTPLTIDGGTRVDLDGSNDRITTTSTLEGANTTLTGYVECDSYDSFGFIIASFTGVFWQIASDTATYIQNAALTHSAIDWNDGTTRRFFAMTNDGTTQKLYVAISNRLYLYATATGTDTALSSGSKNMVIGDWITTPGVNYSLNGRLSDLRLYQATFTESEIFYVFLTKENPSGKTPKKFYKFNEGSGTSATDYGSDNVAATLVNGATWANGASPFYSLRSRATSINLGSQLGGGALQTFTPTLAAKPAGTDQWYRFANDGSSWKNRYGDDCSQVGSCYFSGAVDQYITMGNIPAFRFGRTDLFSFCIDFLAEPTGFSLRATTALFTSFFSQLTDAGKGFWWGQHSDDKIRFVFRDTITTNNIDLRTNTAFSDSKWHRAILTYSGSGTAAGVKFYVDTTTARATTTLYDNLSGDPANSTAEFGIGTVDAGNHTDDAMYGLLANAMIFGRVLASDEIAGWMNSSKIPATPLGLWRLAGDANDSSGNGYHGTVTNATLNTDWWRSPPMGERHTETAGSPLELDISALGASSPFYYQANFQSDLQTNVATLGEVSIVAATTLPTLLEGGMLRGGFQVLSGGL